MNWRVGHETIYQSLYVQTRGELRKDLYRQLSLKRRQRKPRGAGTAAAKSLYTEAFTISRPARRGRRPRGARALGGRPDHGHRRTARRSGTLVERSTRFTILLHLPGRHDAEHRGRGDDPGDEQAARAPAPLDHLGPGQRAGRLSSGSSSSSSTKVYFCDPHAPWQRGTNENTNRLLRFWLEKGTDLSVHTAADLAPDRRHPQQTTPPYPGPAEPQPTGWLRC